MVTDFDMLLTVIVLAISLAIILVLWFVLAPGVSLIELIKRFTLWDLLCGLKITGRELDSFTVRETGRWLSDLIEAIKIHFNIKK